MDGKLVLGFFADILYIKGALCWDEYNTIMEAKCPSDLESIVERMLRSDFNAYKRQGETYDYTFGK